MNLSHFIFIKDIEKHIFAKENKLSEQITTVYL